MDRTSRYNVLENQVQFRSNLGKTKKINSHATLTILGILIFNQKKHEYGAFETSWDNNRTLFPRNEDSLICGALLQVRCQQGGIYSRNLYAVNKVKNIHQ